MLYTLIHYSYNPFAALIGFFLIVVVLIFIIRQRKKSVSESNLIEDQQSNDLIETDVLGLEKKTILVEIQENNSTAKKDNWPIIVLGILLIIGFSVIYENRPQYTPVDYPDYHTELNIPGSSYTYSYYYLPLSDLNDYSLDFEFVGKPVYPWMYIY